MVYKISFVVILLMASAGCGGGATLGGAATLKPYSPSQGRQYTVIKYNESLDIVLQKNTGDVVSSTSEFSTRTPYDYYISNKTFEMRPNYPLSSTFIVRKGVKYKVSSAIVDDGELRDAIILRGTYNDMYMGVKKDGSIGQYAYNPKNIMVATAGRYEPSIANAKLEKKSSEMILTHDALALVYRGKDGAFIKFEEQNLRTGSSKVLKTVAKTGNVKLGYFNLDLINWSNSSITYKLIPYE